MTSPNLLIEHLRLYDSSESVAALKLGVQQALRQVRLHPARLPPHAILVVRRLQSQTPFGLKAFQMYGWQQQIESQIDDLARRAYRPGLQYVPPQADSVLFFDDVELLLCYTRDTLARSTAWYWADLFPTAAYPGQPIGQQLLVGWAAYPQAIPHTLVELKPHETKSALTSLNHSQLSQLAHLLHHTYALPPDVLEAAVPPSIAPSKTGETGEMESVQTAAPWHHWLPPQLYEQLSPQAEYLLGLCHTLVHRPQQARHPRFAHQSRQWLEQPPFLPTTNKPSEINITPARPSPNQLNQPNQPNQPINQSTNQPNYPITQLPTPQSPNHQSPITNHEPPETPTTLGGAIFLVNLLTRLGLPAVIPELAELNPWELLGAMSADMLADQFALHQSDPLWSMINEMAGLESEERWGKWQGASNPEAGSFLLPPEWLSLLPTTAVSCRVESQDGRLRLWHTAAPILVADLPDSPGALEGCLAVYEAAGISMAVEPQPGWTKLREIDLPFIRPNLAWYVARLRPFITHLLENATGQTAVEIIRQPATLFLSRTHLDLRLSLEQISVALRRAGLDRTPGWLPAFGCIVTIYFE